LEPLLKAFHECLSGVSKEYLPFGEFITRYDKPKTLFYLDPPYWGCENDYGKNVFSRADFAALSKQLKAIKGRFIMSINDVEEIRKMFTWAEIEAFEFSYPTRKVCRPKT
jgi:DNA adenine methylase